MVFQYEFAKTIIYIVLQPCIAVKKWSSFRKKVTLKLTQIAHFTLKFSLDLKCNISPIYYS